MRSIAGLSFVAVIAVIAACGAPSTPPTTTPTVASSSSSASIAIDGGAPIAEVPLTDAATWEKWKRADYVMLVPHRFVATVAPLVRHRESGGHVVAVLEIEPLFARFSKGAPDARALKDAVMRMTAHTEGKLKFVLLAGDVDHPSDASGGDAPMPAFYAKKMDYEHHTPEEHSPTGVTQSEHAKYPTDHPLELAGKNGARLAVGRIPARTEDQLRVVIQKIIDYETAEPDGEWRRRVSIFTGPANYGEVADSVIESIANRMLDEELSYDYDVHFAFAKPDSPYAYRLDKLRERFIAELDSGALVAAYVGHGSVASFDHVYSRGHSYPIGTADDAAALRIAAGRPVFFSFACDTGAFDRPAGRVSIAEEMILNPKGPIAVFASSRESHPYANALYAAGVIRKFLDEHAPTVGEGILAVKEAMKTRSIAGAEMMVDVDIDALKREHEGLYNLLGDPAMRLRYPDAAIVTLGAPSAKPGDKVSVTIASATIANGTATITLETPRSVIRGTLVPAATIDAMSRDDAFAAMDENRKKAADKIVSRVTVPVASGRATTTLTMPNDAGPYVVKAIVAAATTGTGGIAVGNAPVRVGR